MAMSPRGGIAAPGRPSRVPARSLGRGLRAFARARLPPFTVGWGVGGSPGSGSSASFPSSSGSRLRVDA
eukprot:1799553-Pleurochrysis_carterae.AAC.1